MVLGIAFVRGDGAIAKAGGKVVKNVAGYDLMKLLIGSYGTLGIVTEVTFRTYPIPEASQTVAISGAASAIAEVIKQLRNSGLTPTAADLVSANLSQQLGLANLTLFVRFQTIPESIKAQSAQLEAMTQGLAVKISNYQGQTEVDLWQKLSEIRTFDNEQTTICKLGILPNQGVPLLEQLATQANPAQVMLHTGSGLGVVKLDNPDPQVIRDIRTFCRANSGFLSILSAPKALKQQVDIWGYQGNALGMMRTIKSKFDPQGVFNSDRYLV